MCNRDLKIQITKSQPLELILNEVTRLGFVKDDTLSDFPNFVYTCSEDNTYAIYMSDQDGFTLASLADLKEMK